MLPQISESAKSTIAPTPLCSYQLFLLTQKQRRKVLRDAMEKVFPFGVTDAAKP